MTHILRGAELDLIAEPQNDLVLRTLVSASPTGSEVSVTWVQLDGRHRRLRSVRTTRIYYVLEGSFDFEINSEKTVSVGKADLVILKSGTEYALSGTGAYLVINAPAYQDGDDVYL